MGSNSDAGGCGQTASIKIQLVKREPYALIGLGKDIIKHDFDEFNFFWGLCELSIIRRCYLVDLVGVGIG